MGKVTQQSPRNRWKMAIGDVIRAALVRRVESGDTFYAIGKATGISQQVIGRFASGDRKEIRLKTVNLLCEYLGLTVAPAGSGGDCKASARKPASRPKLPANTKPARATKRVRSRRGAAGKNAAR